jgi:hypothetical protein
VPSPVLSSPAEDLRFTGRSESNPGSSRAVRHIIAMKYGNRATTDLRVLPRLGEQGLVDELERLPRRGR